MLRRIHPRVEQVSTQFNGVIVELYLVRGEKNIFIDTGITQSPQRDIPQRLKTLGLTLSDIGLILNTHGHFDHTAGNAAVKAASRAQVFIHKVDAAFLHDRERCFELYFAPVVKAMGGNVQAEKKAFSDMAGPAVVPDRQLDDGDLIDAGGGVILQVVHLPGHTLGSAGFFWEREGILFAGDSMVGLHVEGGKIPVILDLEAYMKSVRRLEEMPIKFLLCSHHYRGVRLPPDPVRQGSEVGRYLQDCREFGARLEEAVRKVTPHLFEEGFMQVADEVIAHFSEEMGFKPMTKVERPLYFAQTIFFRLYP